MSEENTRLPDFLLADLYKNSLVITEDEPKTERKTPQPENPASERQWYLGSNLRKITLLVSEKDAVYLKDESLNFLSAILGACKLNLGDVAIVNCHTEAVTYPLLQEKLQPGFLLLFGVNASDVQLPFTIPHYQIQRYDNCQILLAPALESMLGTSQEAKLEKSKLWLCLKKMFNV